MSSARPSSCEQFDVLLDASLDDALQWQEREFFEEHRRDCSRCSVEWTQALQVQDGLHRLPDCLLPEIVSQQVYARTSRATDSRSLSAWRKSLETIQMRWDSRFLRPLLAGAGVVAIVLVLVLVLSLRPIPSSEHYSAREVVEAEREVRIALAYVSHVTRRTSETLLQQTVGDVMGNVLAKQVLVPVTDAMEIPMRKESK